MQAGRILYYRFMYKEKFNVLRAGELLRHKNL